MTEVLNHIQLDENYVLPQLVLTYDLKVKPSQLYQVTRSADSYNILKKYWNQDTFNLLEEMNILYLNRANRVLAIYNLSKGGMTGTVCDPRLIIACALKMAATGIILAHNHPSGNTKPSLADQQLTQKIKTGASYFDINLLDHIILGDEYYYSFADEGLI